MRAMTPRRCRIPPRLHAQSPHMRALRLRADARGGDGGVRKVLAPGVVQLEPKTKVEPTSILPSLNVKTARSRRAIVPSTHLAREGRMTVTIGRRELLAALGGAAAAWPLVADAQGKRVRRIVLLHALAERPASMTATRRRIRSATRSGSRSLSLFA